MNFNALIATLVIKGIITQEEGQDLVEFLHDKPQSTVLSDMIAQIKEFIPMQNQPLTGGPVQQAEELRARELAAEQAAAKAEEEKATEESLPEGGETYEPEADENKSTDKSSKK